jgi:MFS family permease
MRAREYALYFAYVVTSALAPHIAATSKPDATGERPERANKWLVLVLAATSAFLMSLDASIVNIGLPAMARDFGVPLAGSIEWVLIGYLVIIAALLLPLGRLADMLGRKPIFLAGLAIFGIASVACGAAPTWACSSGAGCCRASEPRASSQ